MDYLANMSGKKANSMITKFYEANITEEYKNSEEMKKTIAGLTAEELDEIVFASKRNYVQVVENKLKSGIGPEIVLPEGAASFNLAFYNDTNYYDLARPQGDIDIHDKRERIRKQLSKVDKSQKVIIVFGGNLLGEEWKLANLRNASVLEVNEITEEVVAALSKSKKLSSDEIADIEHAISTGEEPQDPEVRTRVERIVAYWGLKKRLEQLRNDIITYFSVAKKLDIHDIDIVLLNGAQEHEIRKRFNFDPLEKVFNSIKKHYSSVSYVDEGVNVIFPIFTNGKGKNSHHISLNIQTNSLTKAKKAASVERASDIDSGHSDSSATFRLNVANFSGYYNGVFYPTGQALFDKTKRGALPNLAPRDRDVYHIDITGDELCEITRGGSYDLREYELERRLREEKLKQQCIKQLLMEIAQQRIESIVDDVKGDNND